MQSLSNVSKTEPTKNVKPRDPGDGPAPDVDVDEVVPGALQPTPEVRRPELRVDERRGDGRRVLRDALEGSI